MGSAESVVLPVPLRPNSSDERPGLLVGRGRAVHGKQPAPGREVVRHREHALLHFAGVFGAEDDELAVFEAEVNAGLRTDARGQAVGGELAGVVDDEVRLAEVRQLLFRRPDEHRVHEQRVIGPRADHANLDAILRVPAGEAVEAVQALAGVEVVLGAFAVDRKRLRVERDVHRPPPDVLFRSRVLDDPLVLGRPAGLGARVGDQRAVVGDAGILLVTNGVLVERAQRQVAVNLGHRQFVVFQVECIHRCMHCVVVSR